MPFEDFIIVVFGCVEKFPASLPGRVAVAGETALCTTVRVVVPADVVVVSCAAPSLLQGQAG